MENRAHLPKSTTKELLTTGIGHRRIKRKFRPRSSSKRKRIIGSEQKEKWEEKFWQKRTAKLAEILCYPGTFFLRRSYWTAKSQA
jgi:hypothetical protein